MLQQQQEVPILPVVQHVKQQQIWRCDICRVLTFPTFQEACEHEEQCKNSINPTLSEATSSLSTPSICSDDTNEVQDDTVLLGVPGIQKCRGKIQSAQSTLGKKTNQRQRQSTISLVGNKLVQPAPQVHAANEDLKPVKRTLRKTSVALLIEGEVVQVLEALSPQKENRSAASVSATATNGSRTNGSTDSIRTKRGRVVDGLDSNPSAVQTLPNETSNGKKSKNAKAAKKIGAVQSVLKQRSSKTLDQRSKKVTTSHSSASHNNAMMDWFAIPTTTTGTTSSSTIPKGKTQDLIFNVDDGTVSSKLEQERDAKFITEQVVAYEFREERRKKQQLERERQLRRQQLRDTEQRQQQKESTLPSKATWTTQKMDNTNNVAADSANVIRPKKVQSLAAIRFPIQSHVIPSTEVTEMYSDQLETAVPVTSRKQWWNQKTTQPLLRHPVVQKPSSFVRRSGNNGNVGTTIAHDIQMKSFDLLQTAIRSYIVPIQSPAVMATDDIDLDSTLWVDRYYNNTSRIRDDTDSQSSVVYQQIHNFIERFMLARQKIERANLEKLNKQRQHYYGLPTSKPKNNIKQSTGQRAKIDDDDYLWNDDDCTNSNASFDADQGSSLCVISGPVGCGKSNMVHHVSKRLGCRNVVELHTGMKRNAASIKRIIEEATKSHSTFDMLQNQCKGEEEESDDRGSAVTVILIDEVDNLDPNTDCGFWTALSDLHKESKCPIIVTCNSIPKELQTTSFHWTHVPIERPNATECANQLQEILFHAGYTVQLNDSNDAISTTDVLVTIANLGNCDMRRIMHELQLFLVDTSSTLSQHTSNLNMVWPELPNYDSFEPFQFPTIESTHPTVIHSDIYTTLTVIGSNFLSLVDPTTTSDRFHCKVYIGDYCCSQARIMSDSSILAIVAPSQLPSTNRYLPVNVCCTTSLGILSSTRHFITNLDLPDQTRVLACGLPCLVECRPSEIAPRAESDSENEFEADVSREVAAAKQCEFVAGYTLTNENLDPDVAIRMLTEGINTDFRKERCGSLEEQEAIATKFPKIKKDELHLLYNMEAMASLASDASLFEDFGLNIVPMLSGSCRGFGFTYTEDFPKRTNENSKPPTEEHLHLSMWKENASFYGTGDCHMTRLLSCRERKLLRWSESSIRGRSPKYASLLEETDTEDVTDNIMQLSDEDCLHPIDIPISLLDLPNLLRPCHDTFSSVFRYEIHQQRKKSVLASALHLLREYIFTQPKYIRYSGRLLIEAEWADTARCLNDVSMLNCDVFLDYLPMLRCMAVQEQVLELIFKAHAALNQDCPSTNGRRSTRQSKKLGRCQYFDKILPSYAFQRSDHSSKDVRSQLVKMSLLYEAKLSNIAPMVVTETAIAS